MSEAPQSPDAPVPAAGPPVAAGHPGVPAGPGARPPFAVAPTEGRGTRIWWALGAGALALLLCVGGGGAALVGIAVTFTGAVKEQARATVGDYLDALRDQEYPDAYQLLCDRLRKRETLAEFALRQAEEEPRPETYTLSGPTGQELPLEVTADIRYADGTSGSVRYELAQDPDNGQLEVCGEQS